MISAFKVKYFIPTTCILANHISGTTIQRVLDPPYNHRQVSQLSWLYRAKRHQLMGGQEVLVAEGISVPLWALCSADWDNTAIFFHLLSRKRESLGNYLVTAFGLRYAVRMGCISQALSTTGLVLTIHSSHLNQW